MTRCYTRQLSDAKWRKDENMPAVQNMTLRTVAPGEEGALAQLFQLYCYDNSAWSGEALLADGRYDVCDAGLASYVHAAGHTASWIEVDGELAGCFITEPGMAGGPCRSSATFLF